MQVLVFSSGTVEAGQSMDYADAAIGDRPAEAFGH